MSEYTSMIHRADRKIHRLENYRRAFNEYADGVQELENRMSSRFQALKNEYEEMKDGKWEQIADMLIDRSTDISEILHNDRVVKADDSKDMNSWYERIQKQDEQIKKAKEKFVKVGDVIYLEPDNPAYVLEYNWDAIGEFLWRNPDDISDTEYLAFVDMLSEMDTLTLNELFGKPELIHGVGIKSYSPKDSPVLNRTIEIYLDVATKVAELTIFNKDSIVVYDKKIVMDNLTKAIMLKQIKDELMDETAFSGVVTIIEKDESGYIGYELSILNYIPQTYTHINKTIRVHSYAKEPDFSIDEAANDIMISFGGKVSLKETLGLTACNNIRDYAITQSINMMTGGFIGKWSIPGTIYTAAMSFTQTLENRDKATSGIEELAKGNQLMALDIYANVVTVSGDVNEVILFNSHYNLEELAIRVGAYNTMHKNAPILVDELIESIEKGDLALVEKFTKWYGDVGKKEYIEPYREKLQHELSNYCESRNNMENIGLSDLTYEQIQELIKKMENQEDKINEEIRGIK